MNSDNYISLNGKMKHDADVSKCEHETVKCMPFQSTLTDMFI